jgi:hypothetical protein
MINANIKVTQIEELIYILKLCKKENIEVNLYYSDKSSKTTKNNREIRQDKLLYFIKKHKKILTSDFLKYKKYPCNRKTLIRDLFELQQKNLISMDLIEKSNGGFVYLISYNEKI